MPIIHVYEPAAGFASGRPIRQYSVGARVKWPDWDTCSIRVPDTGYVPLPGPVWGGWYQPFEYMVWSALFSA